MPITYTWSFPNLDVVYNEIDPQTGEAVQNVVITVHWVYLAQDGDCVASLYGTVGLEPPGQPFVAYDDLTPEIVQGWVEAVIGAERISEMQANLADQISELKNPTGGSMPPPWQS